MIKFIKLMISKIFMKSYKSYENYKNYKNYKKL
jgi:hypothetical protein